MYMKIIIILVNYHIVVRTVHSITDIKNENKRKKPTAIR